MNAIVEILTHFIQANGSYGLLVIFAIIFTGCAIAFFLPGDSLLFACGILIAQHVLGFWPVVIVGIIAAILGNNFGYWIGKKFGQAILTSEKKWFFKKEHVDKVEKFYSRYGPFTVLISMFVPGVRTVAPIAAGVGTMTYKSFFIYNCCGAILWSFLILGAGDLLGITFPQLDNLIILLALVFIVIVMLVSFVPGFISYQKNRKSQ